MAKLEERKAEGKGSRMVIEETDGESEEEEIDVRQAAMSSAPAGKLLTNMSQLMFVCLH